MSIKAVATSAQIPGHVVDRELRRVAKTLSLTNVASAKVHLNKRIVKSVGPGNILSLPVEYEAITEVVDVVGERDVSAETIADKAIAQLNRYLASNIVVGEYLADQLLLPMALGGGGSFTTLDPSMHLLTNAAVIRDFTRSEILIGKVDKDNWRIVVDDDN